MAFVGYLQDYIETNSKSSFNAPEAEVEEHIILASLHLSPSKGYRRRAYYWLDNQAALNEAYRTNFPKAIPGYTYTIPEIGPGVFLCISPVLSYTENLPRTSLAQVYNNITEYNKDVYLFVNSNKQDDPFYVTRRMLDIFIGRSTSDSVIDIINSNLDKLRTAPESILSSLSICDSPDVPNDTFDLDDRNDRLLIEKLNESAIKAVMQDSDAPIDVQETTEDITSLITNVNSNNVKSLKADTLDTYLEWATTVSMTKLRETLKPEDYAKFNRMNVKNIIQEGIENTKAAQRKAIEMSYVDENSEILPEQQQLTSQSEIDAPVYDSRLFRYLFEGERNNSGQNFVGKIDPNSLNYDERENIEEEQTRTWGDFWGNMFIAPDYSDVRRRGMGGYSKKYTRKGNKRSKHSKKYNTKRVKYAGGGLFMDIFSGQWFRKLAENRQKSVGKANNIIKYKQALKSEGLNYGDSAAAKYNDLYDKVWISLQKRDRSEYEAHVERLNSLFSNRENIDIKNGIHANSGVIAQDTIIATGGVFAAIQGTLVVKAAVGAGGLVLSSVAFPLVVAALGGIVVYGFANYAVGETRAMRMHSLCREITSKLILDKTRVLNTQNKVSNAVSKMEINVQNTKSPNNSKLADIFKMVNLPNSEKAHRRSIIAAAIYTATVVGAIWAKQRYNAHTANTSKKPKGPGVPQTIGASNPSPTIVREVDSSPTNGNNNDALRRVNNTNSPNRKSVNSVPPSDFTIDNTYVYFGHGEDVFDKSSRTFSNISPPEGCAYVNSTQCGITTTEPWDTKVIPSFADLENTFLLDPFTPDNVVKINETLNEIRATNDKGPFCSHTFEKSHKIYDIAVYYKKKQCVLNNYFPLQISPTSTAYFLDGLKSDKTESDEYKTFAKKYFFWTTPFAGIMSINQIKNAYNNDDFKCADFSRKKKMSEWVNTPEDWPLTGFYEMIKYDKFKKHYLTHCTYPNSDAFDLLEKAFAAKYNGKKFADYYLTKTLMNFVQQQLKRPNDWLMRNFKGLHYNFLCRYSSSSTPEARTLQRIQSMGRTPKEKIIEIFYNQGENLENFRVLWEGLMEQNNIKNIRDLHILFNVPAACNGTKYNVAKSAFNLFTNSVNTDMRDYNKPEYTDKKTYISTYLRDLSQVTKGICPSP